MILALVLALSQWVGIVTGPGVVVTADCNAGTTVGSVWAAVGGTHYLDIIQVGVLEGRFFAAWGDSGGFYKQVDLGPASKGSHRFTVQLKGTTWRLYIDRTVRVLVPDTFRHWAIRSRNVMAETNSATDHFGSTWCRATGGAWRWFATLRISHQSIYQKGYVVGFRLT